MLPFPSPFPVTEPETEQFKMLEFLESPTRPPTFAPCPVYETSTSTKFTFLIVAELIFEKSPAHCP